MEGPMFRQGDVLITRVDVPERSQLTLSGEGEVVLAEGEATGHAHRVKGAGASLWTGPEGGKILVLEEEAPLIHEEHATIHLHSGSYAVIRQREYVPARRPRRVID